MSSISSDIRMAVGVMTGTSIDGIDAALVRIEGRGVTMRASLMLHASESLGDLQPRLRAAANQQPLSAGDFSRLSHDFGMLHADVLHRLLQDQRPDLICIHGQTVFHQPPISWQLVNPAPIAARFCCPIVSDLRQADLAHGGRGAPITPIADWILFRNESTSRAVINLGGFCNVTIIPCSASTHATWLNEIRGFDVCACNQVLDAVAREVLGRPFDEDGTMALRGCALPAAVEALSAILDRQRLDHRSLGTGDEAHCWIRSHRDECSPADLAASAVQAIAQTIIAAVTEHAACELILAGGGARNQALCAAIADAHRAHAGAVRTTQDFGVPLEAREAMCFAVLGALCQDRVPITLPQITGCTDPAPVSGVWTNLV